MANPDSRSGASGGNSSPDLREQASHAAEQVQQQAQAFLSEQKAVAANHIEGVARVLHDTVDQLRQRSPGAVTDYAERAVGGLDSLADALREQDVRALVGHVEDFARRQPVLFVAGTAAIGFALARFLKSSGRNGDTYAQATGTPRAYRPSSTGTRANQPRTEFSRHMDTEPSPGQGVRRPDEESR